MIKNERISAKTQHLRGRGWVEVSAQRPKWRVEKVRGHPGRSQLLFSVDIITGFTTQGLTGKKTFSCMDSFQFENTPPPNPNIHKVYIVYF